MVQCKILHVGLWVFVQPSQQNSFDLWPAVTNAGDAAQVVTVIVLCPLPLFAGLRSTWAAWKPVDWPSGRSTLTKLLFLAHFVWSLQHQRGPVQLQHVTVSSSPCDQRQHCLVVLWSPPREGRGDGIRLLFGPECEQGAALGHSAAKLTNNCSLDYGFCRDPRSLCTVFTSDLLICAATKQNSEWGQAFWTVRPKKCWALLWNMCLWSLEVRSSLLEWLLKWRKKWIKIKNVFWQLTINFLPKLENCFTFFLHKY